MPKPTVARPAAAEKKALDVLPDTRFWEGTKAKGTVMGATKVCVDFTLSKRSEQRSRGGVRGSYIIVNFPGLRDEYLQPGTCVGVAAEANEKVRSDRLKVIGTRFYLGLDDDTQALRKAVQGAQEGQEEAAERIAELRTGVANRLAGYSRESGATSAVAGRVLLAATTAQEAAQNGDDAQLAALVQTFSDLRDDVAEEALE